MVIFYRRFFSPVLRPTGWLRATCLTKMSSYDSLSSSMFIYIIGSISVFSTFLGGSAAGDGAICLVGSGAVDAGSCNYRTIRVHFDNPSRSSTSFNRFLWRSTVLVSSWSDGERSAPFRLSWCFSPRPAWSYFSTA
jgi:hypothetical protein